MPLIKDLGMIPNFRAKSVACEDSAATFVIRYQETCCSFPADDAAAASFSDLPVEDMHPQLLASATSPITPSVGPSVEATDGLTEGFLQRKLN